MIKRERERIIGYKSHSRVRLCVCSNVDSPPKWKLHKSDSDIAITRYWMCRVFQGNSVEPVAAHVIVYCSNINQSGRGNVYRVHEGKRGK